MSEPTTTTKPRSWKATVVLSRMRGLTPFGDTLPDYADVRFIEFANNAFDPLPEVGLKEGIVLAMGRPLDNVIGNLAKECVGQKVSSCLPPELLAGFVTVGLGEDGDARGKLMISGNDGDLHRLKLQARRLEGEVNDASFERVEPVFASS